LQNAQTPPQVEAAPPLVRVEHVSKHYGHVTALDDVSVDLYAGDVLALVGDNGAGKTTLVSVLAGFVALDAGRICVDGEAVHIESPRRAQDLGIATVFQDLALVDQRDVAANLYLAREPRRLGVFVNRRRMLRDAARAIADLGVRLPSVRTRVGELSGGQRQAVAVARSLLQGGRVVLLDEPTAALGVREAQRVLELVDRLRASGRAVLFITHNLDNVYTHCDRVMVMRHGRRVALERVAETSRDQLVALIVGGRSEDGAGR
jgi:ABC-type sugar transport system ATPase subunit